MIRNIVDSGRKFIGLTNITEGSMSVQPMDNSTPVTSTLVNSTPVNATFVQFNPGQLNPSQLNP